MHEQYHPAEGVPDSPDAAIQATYDSLEWQPLASGGWGAVYKAYLPVALKVPISSSPQYQDAINMEALIMLLFSHPNIVRPLAMVDCGDGVRGMLMEHFELGSLADRYRCAAELHKILTSIYCPDLLAPTWCVTACNENPALHAPAKSG